MTSYERGVDEDPARLKKKKKNNQYVAMGPELKACFFFDSRKCVAQDAFPLFASPHPPRAGLS